MSRLVASGAEVERASGSQRIERHHHEAPYAALILRGGYVEAGDRGRVRAEAGDALFHGAFEGHFDSIESSGAEILNLPLASEPRFALGKCGDADAVVRLAVQDPASAADLLLSSTIPAQSETFDWPDLLATALCRDPHIRLDAWASELGLSASALSRGFAQAYGVTPKRFRLELKAAAAARAIRRGAALCDTAYATGFADQPHMTRAVASVFGRSPAKLRA